MRLYQPASERAVQSLQNWLNSNACISRAESRFLECKQDLSCTAGVEAGAFGWWDSLIEDGLMHCYRMVGKVCECRSCSYFIHLH